MADGQHDNILIVHRHDLGRQLSAHGHREVVWGDIPEALGRDRRHAPAPITERQADARSGEWFDRYRDEAPRLGLPT